MVDLLFGSVRGSGLYADDTHLKWRFETYVELERSMMEVRVAMGIFKAFHMKVNYEKTKAILKVVGGLRSRVHKEYVRKYDQERRLLLSPRDPTAWVALVPQAEYLGLIISYGAFELQSMRHRVSKANKRRWAMAGVLHSRRISVGYKLQIWRSCVLSTLTYGLHCCGLTGAHITGDSHETIMDKFGVQTVVGLLLKQQSALEPEGAESAVWSCPVCEEAFTTSAALKVHARRSHDIVDEHKEIFNKARHSKNGLPICKFHDRKFSKWQSLAVHISDNSCPALIAPPEEDNDPGFGSGFANTPALPTTSSCDTLQPSTATDSMSICPLPDVQTAVQKGINAFILLKAITAQLQQTCSICGQWVASHRTLKRYFQYSHNDILEVLGSRIQKLVARTATASPACHFCGVACKDWRGMFDDDEMTEFFGELRDSHKNKRRRPEARGAPQGPQAVASQSAAGGLTLTSLARIVLRQDEELRVIKQDHSLVLWLKAGADSFMPFFHQTTMQFRKKQEEAPDWSPGWQPLRTVMALAMIRELATRMEAAMKDESLRKTVAEKGWLDGQGNWRYQGWNPRLGCLEEDKDRQPLATDALKLRLEEIYAALEGETVTHFKCTRRLTETMESQAVFKMDISTRCEGITAWNKLLEVQGNSVWQLVGVAYRKESLKDSPAIQKLRELLRSECGDGIAEMWLTLGNNSNACYMNSLVQALLWAAELHGDTSFLCLGQCAYFFRQLCAHPPNTEKLLIREKTRNALIVGWSDPHRQQDVMEFAAFLCD
ncbi:PKAR [Symbiodinium sp. CCMP2592]|nr:PKAR [Symbiodinium sp. CCMP2592]